MSGNARLHALEHTVADYSKWPRHTLDIAYRAVQGSLATGKAVDVEAARTKQAEMSLELRKRERERIAQEKKDAEARAQKARERAAEKRALKATAPRPAKTRERGR